MFGVPSLVSSCGSLATTLCIAGALPKPKIGLFTGFYPNDKKCPTDQRNHANRRTGAELGFIEDGMDNFSALASFAAACRPQIIGFLAHAAHHLAAGRLDLGRSLMAFEIGQRARHTSDLPANGPAAAAS